MSIKDCSPQQYAVMRQRQTDRIECMGRLEGSLLLDIEQNVGSCLKWPTHFTEMMLSNHLSFEERWPLTKFLLGNRCPPTLMVEWYLKRGMLSDKSARDNVADIIRQHKDGTLERQNRTTWIMGATVTKPLWERKHKWDGVGDPTYDKKQVIETPSFASDWKHQYYWTDAINTLKMPPPCPTTVTKASKRLRV